MVLVVVIAAMYAMGTTWAKRLRTISAAKVGGTQAVSQEQFEEILHSKRPYTIAAIGFVGLLAILWLMIFKPTLGFGGTEAECSPTPDAAVTVCAFDDQSFSSDRLTAPAGEAFGLVFDNEDDGVPHNVAIYTDDSAAESLFVGDLVDGPKTVTYDVPALPAGSYTFVCTVHPNMVGTLTAQ